jgi:hypothetical protein
VYSKDGPDGFISRLWFFFLSACLHVEKEQRTREMIEIPWVAILKSIAEEAVIL